MCRMLVLTMTCILVLGMHLSTGAQVEEVEKKTKKAIEVKIEVQKLAAEWIEEKEAIINEMRQIKKKNQWYDFQNTKFQKYVNNQRNKIQTLQKEKEELDTMRLELEPYLQKRIDSLQSSIEDDLPFLVEERASRIKYLHNSLYDPDISLAEKMQRILKAYQVEAKYGKTLGVEQRTLKAQGKSFKANVLRVGRVGLFYRSLDGSRIGKWDAQQGEWIPLDDGYKQNIKKTIDIARQQKTVELVNLPIGGVRE